eukprot:12352173-Alexandrium_andersonii.AAC.1
MPWLGAMVPGTAPVGASILHFQVSSLAILDEFPAVATSSAEVPSSRRVAQLPLRSWSQPGRQRRPSPRPSPRRPALQLRGSPVPPRALSRLS